MTAFFSYLRSILILALNVVQLQGALTPHGNVSVDCGSTQTFTCNAPGEPIKWTTSGLREIKQEPFQARIEAIGNNRVTSKDTGDGDQTSVSDITISEFSRSDNGGTIQCINANNSNVRGMATISVGLLAPANVMAKAKSCNTVTLQWTQPSESNDITTSVSCTPPSPGCAECTTNPCTIAGLNPSTEYDFTVTLNSTMCGTSMNTTRIRTRDLRAPANVVAVRSCDTVTLQWDQPSEPNDITTSVNCTPPSPGCAECTTSPCTITGLNPSIEYEFTVTLNNGGCRTSMNTTTARTRDSCLPTEMPGTSNPSTSPLDTSASLAALVLLLLPIPLIYPLGVLIAQLLFFKDKTYCEVFWCCFCWRKDKSNECNSTELREHRKETEYHNVAKKEQVLTNGDESKEPKKSKQEVVADKAFKKQEAKDGMCVQDVITDETVQQQGTPDGHHKQRRSHQRKEEVQYQNLGEAKKQESVTNGDEVKKPKRSKQEVINTGNVKQQQGNPDGIQYADLDFSEHQAGRNVIIPLVDPVTYADV